MYTILIIIALLGAFLTVNSVDRAETRDLGRLNVIFKNKKTTQTIGLLAMLVPLAGYMVQMHWLTALIIWLFLMVLIWMMVVVLNPIQRVRYVHIMLLIIVIMLIEISVTYAG